MIRYPSQRPDLESERRGESETPTLCAPCLLGLGRASGPMRKRRGASGRRPGFRLGASGARNLALVSIFLGLALLDLCARSGIIVLSNKRPSSGVGPDSAEAGLDGGGPGRRRRRGRRNLGRRRRRGRAEVRRPGELGPGRPDGARVRRVGRLGRLRAGRGLEQDGARAPEHAPGRRGPPPGMLSDPEGEWPPCQAPASPPPTSPLSLAPGPFAL